MTGIVSFLSLTISNAVSVKLQRKQVGSLLLKYATLPDTHFFFFFKPTTCDASLAKDYKMNEIIGLPVAWDQ